MIYARLASGYRPGGANVFGASVGNPAEYGPDKTQNYEVGVKGNILDHVLSFDVSLYHIDWKDVQTAVAGANNLGYTANLGRAKSQGLELSVESRPLRGLRITTWGAWNNAVLTEDFPPLSTTFAVSGDRLPINSRFSGHFAVYQEFPLRGSMTGFVGPR